MSSLGELSQRYVRLQEINSIMTAMKTLALVETNKLARFIEHQRLMLSNIDKAAADFQSFYSVEHYDSTKPAILIVIGSQRGFCGNFNEHVIDSLVDLPVLDKETTQLIVVGSRLNEKLHSDSYIIVNFVDGATVTE